MSAQDPIKTRLWTWTTAKCGRVHRDVLRDRIVAQARNIDPANFKNYLGDLEEAGILKPGLFEKSVLPQIGRPEDLTSKMISSSLKTKDLEKNAPELAVDSQSYFCTRSDWWTNHIGDGFLSPEKNWADFKYYTSLAMKAARYGLTAYFIMQIPTLAAMGVPFGTIAIVKYANQHPFPAHSKLAKAVHFANRWAVPAIGVAGLALSGGISFTSSLNLAVGFNNYFGEGVLHGLALTAAYCLYRYVRNHVEGLKKAYGGELSPGNKSAMAYMTFVASMDIVTSLFYLTVRGVLLVGSTACIISNIGWLATGVAVGIPLAFLIAQIAYSWHHGAANLEGRSETFCKVTDFFKAYGWLIGLAVGGGVSLIFGAAVGSLAVPIACGVFWGQLATLAVNELHGTGHAINTSLGELVSLKTTVNELIGKAEIAKLIKGKKVLVINPYGVNTAEHTSGLFFTLMCNRNPEIFILGMHDRPPVSTDFSDNIAYAKKYFDWVRGIQTEIFTTLSQGLLNGKAPVNQQEKYRTLAANLRQAAELFKPGGELERRYRQKMKEEKKWFMEDLEEYHRAAYQALYDRGREMLADAERLEQKANLTDLPPEDYKQELKQVIGCFDPTYVKETPCARKEVWGDDWIVRKTENVAAFFLFIGQTVYRCGRMEGDRPHPTVDWVCGTWTKIDNPDFDYEAAPGTPEASKSIWIKRDQTLNPIQREHEKKLSTSKRVASLDNKPTEAEGFIEGKEEKTITVCGKEIKLQPDQYFYEKDSSRGVIPLPKEINERDDVDKSQAAIDSYYNGYYIGGGARLANKVIPDWTPDLKKRLEPTKADNQPSAFSIGLFDYSLMMDKNDVEVESTLLLPALLVKEKVNKYARLVFKYPMGLFGGTFHFADPHTELALKKVELLDASLEFSYRGKSIPYMVERSVLSSGHPNEKVDWTSLKRAIRMADGRVKLIYDKHTESGQLGDFEVILPESHTPKYLPLLELEEGKDIPLDVNCFKKTPDRDGNITYYKITHLDAQGNELLSFARTPDGKRPIMFDKDGQQYYKLEQNRKTGEIVISDIHFPVGLPIKLAHGWGEHLEQDTKFTAIDQSGEVYIDEQGQFTPIRPESGAYQALGKTAVIGQVVLANGQTRAIGLQQFGEKDQYNRVLNNIEIVPIFTADGSYSGKCEVIERRCEAAGLSENQSAHIYHLNLDAVKEVKEAIPDLSWISNVWIDEERGKVVIECDKKWNTSPLELDFSLFRDNDKKRLLDNPEAGVTGAKDLYQRRDGKYTEETGRFAPKFDIFDGKLSLVVHKVKTSEMAVPLAAFNGLNLSEIERIHPTTAVAAAKTEDGSWVPLPLKQPLEGLPEIDLHFSQIEAGAIKSVVGPQTRFGNMGEMSGEYPRDPTFYGLPTGQNEDSRAFWGENFAIEFAKWARAERAIQSGRTHCKDIYFYEDPFGIDIIETNNPNFIKVSDYGHPFNGPGVSEDTQAELGVWMSGIRMKAVKKMVARFNAEKKWNAYKTQSGDRYNYSEALMVMPFHLVLLEMKDFLLNPRRPLLIKLAAMMEIIAGRTWYKLPFAKMTEAFSIPVFLGTLGYVPWFPVDLTIFLVAWSLKTAFSGLNYLTQLWSIGYGFVTAFVDNPAFEWTFMFNYKNGAVWQRLRRPQFGTFAQTNVGAQSSVPAENKKFINNFANLTGVTVLFAAASIILSGVSLTLLTWPLGFAVAINMIFGLYNRLIFGRSSALMKREAADRAKQKVFADMQREHLSMYTLLRDIERKVYDNADSLDYTDLFIAKALLCQIVQNLGNEVDQKGRMKITVSNPYRDISNLILEQVASIEMIIGMRAMEEIGAKWRNNDAQRALKKVLRETREYAIINTFAQLQHQVKISKEVD